MFKNIYNWIKKKIVWLFVGGIVLAGGLTYGDLNKNEISLEKLTAKYEQATEIKAKYQIDNASLVKTDIKNPELDKYKNEPKDEIKITLGDKDATEFSPNIELKRWNEVSFKLKTDNLLKNVATKDKNLSFEGEKIKFTTPKISFEMFDYSEGEGGYKFIWYLNEKPATNKVEFQIESSGLDFFYQPELTPEEIAQGAFRPENVVGSYAVYHSTKGGMNDAYGKDYKTGKAFHIYRSKAIDANGDWVWEDINIDVEKGLLTVTTPQEFLDNAVYPIKSNSLTFGYETVGVSTTNLGFNVDGTDANKWSYRIGEAWTGVDGTLDSLHVAGQASGGTPTMDTTAFVNQENAVTDSHLQISSVEILDQSYTTTKTFYTFTASNESLSSGNKYILNALGNGADLGTGIKVSTLYDIGGSSRNRYNEAKANLSGYADNKENPWTNAETANTNLYSIYATYTPAGDGAAVPEVQQFLWEE